MQAHSARKKPGDETTRHEQSQFATANAGKTTRLILSAPAAALRPTVDKSSCSDRGGSASEMGSALCRPRSEPLPAGSP